MGRKKKQQLYGYFKRQTTRLTHEKNWKWLEILREKTEYLQRAAQNNVILLNYINTHNDNPQEISKGRLFGERNEMFNHIICEC